MKMLFRFVMKGFWILLLPVALQGQTVSSFILIDQFGYFGIPNFTRIKS
ncbi:MAG: hypothetical protein LBI82_00040 [Dysgonamonadaceae bacterium]|jgi:hypothetical protein|nr:hypothetical protein [Dysgonamonadaceae bacterium]